MITTHTTNQRVSSRTKPSLELLTRTSWTDALTALLQIKKGRAEGNKCSLKIRTKLQFYFYTLGLTLHRNAYKAIFWIVLFYLVLSGGLKSYTFQHKLQKLWVPEGGRLEKEMKYSEKVLGEGFSTTDQYVIQTGKTPNSNVLRVENLLEHEKALRLATEVSFDLDDVTWSLKDICHSPSTLIFEAEHIDLMLKNMFPCAIATPLDCFWEGSLLLGPEIPISVPGLNMQVQWSNLNPQGLFESMKNFAMSEMDTKFSFGVVESFMKRAGITSGYQKKPCLDPTNPSCPDTAPNKASKQVPDVGKELTGGCYGFATTYMHWPESMIVGGATKNQSGHLERAEALQSVVQLMTDKEMYEYYKNNYKVLNYDWSLEKAKKVLEEWQKMFREVIETLEPENTKYSLFYDFSSSSLEDIFKNFSHINPLHLSIGYILVLVYMLGSLYKKNDHVRSNMTLGIAAIFLLILSETASLGLCGYLRIPLNTASTQIVPFLALGLGIYNFFVLINTYEEIRESNILFDKHTAECLKRAGPPLLLTTSLAALTFTGAGFIPIPALRTFSWQLAIMLGLNFTAMILVFPCLVVYDSARQRNRRLDLACCWKSKSVFGSSNNSNKKKKPVKLPKQMISRTLSHESSQVVTELADPELGLVLPHKPKFTYQFFITKIYSPFLQKSSVKVTGVLLFIFGLVISAWSISRVENGLELTDIVPRGTASYKFLEAQKQYFGFYHVYAVTQGNFEYPTNQALLHQYHHAFSRIEKIVKNDDGGLPSFWLATFRDWLLDLQKMFDQDWKDGCITNEHWFPNASEKGIFAFKLLAQSGRMDHPVDKSQVIHGRLVDKNGIINPKSFYNYLTAWASNDPFAYSASQASLYPEPRLWIHDPADVELKIPKSQHLTYTQLPFFLDNMKTTEDITNVINEFRAICEKFEERGLPNFPSGVPFIYWEQYIGLKMNLAIILGSVLVAIFAILSLFFFSCKVAFIMVAILISIVLELFGLMVLVGIKLSAVLAFILIVSVGIGVNFTTFIMLGYLTSIGDRDRRVAMALEHMSKPVLHGALTTQLGVAMLFFSSYDFIVYNFFYVLFGSVCIGLANGLFFMPLLLSIWGPQGEVIPNDNPERIATPSPPMARSDRSLFNKSKRKIIPQAISLTTISEESQSQFSDIIVQPEVVVETVTDTTVENNLSSPPNTPSPAPEEIITSSPTPTTTTVGCNCSSSSRSPTPENCTVESRTISSFGQGVTTRITTTTTAKVKLEVHAPVSGVGDRYYKSISRRLE